MSGLNSIAGRRGVGSGPVKRTSSANRISPRPSSIDADTVSKPPTVPFPSDTPRAPASRPSAGKSEPHAAEKALLDQLMGPAVGSSKSSGSGGSSSPAGARGGASSGSGGDPGLLTAMAARLAKLEASQRVYRDELVRKDREVLDLKREVESLKTSATVSEAASELMELKRENDGLRQQIHEMETFLNDYGLIWVGNTSSSSSSDAPAASSSDTPSSSSSPAPAPASAAAGGAAASSSSSSEASDFKVNFGLLQEKVKVLNAVAGDGKAKIVEKGGAHQLRMPEGIPFTVFTNGFMLRRGPFRPYSDSRNRAFMNDILDGYFPYEFKEGYPDGIIFDLKDRSDETYDKDTFKPFTGEGKAVGGPGKPKTLADLGNPDFAMGAQEFLNALPQSVIRNGNVIEVRSGVAEMLRGAPAEDRPDVVVVNTPVMRTIRGVDGRPITPHDITTLRVKSDTGKQTLIIKLRYDDTIADLRTAIDDHRTTGGEYELRTTFPNKVYTDDSQTLRDAGLTPNATIMVRSVSKK